MGVRADLGIVRSESTKTGRIFEELTPGFLTNEAPEEKPSAYIHRCWMAYQRRYPKEDVGTNGKFSELCIATLLGRLKQRNLVLAPEVKVVTAQATITRESLRAVLV